MQFLGRTFVSAQQVAYERCLHGWIFSCDLRQFERIVTHSTYATQSSLPTCFKHRSARGLCTTYVEWSHIQQVTSVCLSVSVIQVENRWTDLDEIWYGHFGSGNHPKIVHFNFPQSIISIWRTNNLEGGVNTGPLATRQYGGEWLQILGGYGT